MSWRSDAEGQRRQEEYSEGCPECRRPDPSGHASHGMKCPRCWEAIPTLDEKRAPRTGGAS